ncbi:hypothetical protein EVAR_36778_1 [Eumeta japonica]|uniref:Uncharacterized protein n=1 Tax=Eumeta variegata TaxID=151549 RepID=A0A4C1X1Z2_EUMVA|nr:hypothetical protein EVAR_36778_1 [Eumeta japonica]
MQENNTRKPGKVYRRMFTKDTYAPSKTSRAPHTHRPTAIKATDFYFLFPDSSFAAPLLLDRSSMTLGCAAADGSGLSLLLTGVANDHTESLSRTFTITDKSSWVAMMIASREHLDRQHGVIVED